MRLDLSWKRLVYPHDLTTHQTVQHKERQSPNSHFVSLSLHLHQMNPFSREKSDGVVVVVVVVERYTRQSDSQMNSFENCEDPRGLVVVFLL